jgi:protein transport protein SEC61 subunit gamma-like protein
MINKMKEFFDKCKRVWKVTRKPTMNEFKVISKVSAIGILVIGFIGFLISLLMNLILR